jgi:hypothetical protein
MRDESKGITYASLRIPNEIYAAAKAAAEEDDRSLHAYILRLIKRDLRRRQDPAATERDLDAYEDFGPQD